MEQQEILLAEDEPMIRIMVEEALIEAGFAVCGVANGQDAVDLLNASDRNFSGIVTDIRMPGSTNGWQVARRARELKSDMPIIYISADSEPDWAVHGVPESIFIQKPFAAGQVITALSTLLNKSS